MPIYEYACSQCGKLNEVLQKVNDPAPETCDGCGARSTLSRVVSRTSFVLKGGGWYSDLYSSVKKDGSKASSSPPPSSGSGAASSSSSSGSSSAGSSSSSGAPKVAAAPAKS